MRPQDRGREQEVLAQAGRHAVEAHGMTVTPEIVAVVRGHIREAKTSPAGGQ